MVFDDILHGYSIFCCAQTLMFFKRWLVTELIFILQIVTASYTDLQDYTYYFVPAPWLSVKLLRLLQNYPPPGGCLLLTGLFCWNETHLLAYSMSFTTYILLLVHVVNSKHVIINKNWTIINHITNCYHCLLSCINKLA